MNIIKTVILITLLPAFVASATAQDSIPLDAAMVDTTIVGADPTAIMDSIYYYDNEEESSEDDTASEAIVLPPDSAAITIRPANQNVIDQLKEDADMNYDVDSPAVWSVWDRFRSWLSNLIDSLFSWGEYTDWGQFFTFLFVIIILSFVILKLLRVDTVKMFYGAPKTSAGRYAIIEEDIHVMDFDKLIQDALQKKAFRLAIRLTFLQSLKMLADHHHIYWEPGKTNHDYLDELKATSLKSGFAQLNYYFEYAWYGNFNITQDTFTHVRDLFNKWKGNIH
jgi:hypothetical protein